MQHQNVSAESAIQSGALEVESRFQRSYAIHPESFQQSYATSSRLS